MTSERDWASPLSPYALVILRLAYGLLWLQQALWKVPPDFGRVRGDGLYYWTQQMAQYSSLAPHKLLVTQVVLPHFLLFAWLTLLTELFIAGSHLLGLVSRLGALAAIAMSTNLLIGLGRHPQEWAWSYLMLLGYGLLFLTTHPGRVCGVDGWLARYLPPAEGAARPWVKALGLII